MMSAAEEKRLELLAEKALQYLRVKAAPPAVFLLSDARMRRLGHKFLREKHSHTPDVLSFSEPKRFPHPESRRRVLGEVYINNELKNERRAPLLFHGLLHLLGYTHNKKSDILKMQKLERKLAKKFRN